MGFSINYQKEVTAEFRTFCAAHSIQIVLGTAALRLTNHEMEQLSSEPMTRAITQATRERT